MSKAFTKEEDGDFPDIAAPVPRAPLPFGAKNYITRASADRFREEMARLTEERARWSKPGASVDHQTRLSRIDMRLRFLEEIFQTAVVVDPPTEPETKAR